jgi:hypothetical protein
MINFNDPYPKESYNACDHKNINGNPCTRLIGHSMIDVNSENFISKISKISEQV